MAWRNGDFSDLLALDPAKYQIYDPRTARLVGGRVVRDPFPGNKGIPILNPMYKTYVNLYPKPNDVPAWLTRKEPNNYFASAMPKNEKFNSMLNRFDYNISDRQRINGQVVLEPPAGRRVRLYLRDGAGTDAKRLDPHQQGWQRRLHLDHQ